MLSSRARKIFFLLSVMRWDFTLELCSWAEVECVPYGADAANMWPGLVHGCVAWRPNQKDVCVETNCLKNSNDLSFLYLT